MSLYASDYPRDVQFDAEFKAFFENFYKLSDTPGANEEYAAQFTENATLIMASNKVVGRDDIRTMRAGMWDKVSSRRHYPTRIFPFGTSSDEVMLYGSVDYGMKDGSNASKDWAARAHLVKEGIK
ncbi:hypothetical protein H2203_002040 [Taxawa tesnikishii (nom. ined.)]|nr:hypothetical protein H2203_002040 [Dothideales sp. JES 119]